MGEKSLRGRVVVLLVLAAMVFQASFIATSEDSNQDELYGGTLRVALKGEVTNLNPLTAVDDVDWQVIDVIYDSLARLKTDTNNNVMPEPWLAESWTVIDDDHVNVELRTGLKWHDMSNVTADDVVYTFSDPAGMKSSAKFKDILANLSAVKVGSHNVQFNLSNFENKGWFFTRVLTVPIIPDDFDPAAKNGCGPYKFKSFDNQIGSVTNEVIILSAKGDETHASMRHRFVSSGALITRNDTDWTGFYTLHEASGSITMPTPPVPTSRVNATYVYDDKGMTVEAFDDYFYRKNPFNKGPYLDEIKYTFYPDSPDTKYYDEGADKAIIDLILGNIDVIGFGLSSIEVSADRYHDVEAGEKTKLSDETWKRVASFNIWD
jgi:ABC-type transport system substrate-binding protein